MNPGSVHDPLTEKIIRCIVAVHRTLGPGFLENVYRKALMIELRKASFQGETEREVVIRYDGQEVGIHRLDILVEQSMILELKTVEYLAPSHFAQARAYLRATGLTLALLVNFSKARSDFRRILV